MAYGTHHWTESFIVATALWAVVVDRKNHTTPLTRGRVDLKPDESCRLALVAYGRPPLPLVPLEFCCSWKPVPRP